ncbi:MAG: MFS transporter [Chloroflexi bacterium]|nr:MFS transporter [Chloroflexota bacterium]
MLKALFESFSPLRDRNYRTYIAGQAVSLIGTFMQQVAQQWYVWEITHDSRWIGVVGAMAFMPLLLLGPFTGSIADRVDRRKLLLVTQIAEMLLAFVLSALVFLGVREIWPVVLLAALLGISASFNFPAQSAFIGDLSGMGEIRKAMAFNVTMIEIGRLIGPALAGWVVAAVGAGLAFGLNGLSFVAVIVSLLLVRSQQVRRPPGGTALGDFVEALRYLRAAPRIVDLLLCGLLVTLFVFPSLSLSAPIADEVLKGGPQLMGFLLAASGGGALVGALLVAPQVQKVARAGFALLLAILWSGFWLIATSLATTAPLVIIGVGLYSVSIPVVLASVNALTQMLAPSHMRARLLSVSQMISFGAQPIGALVVGWTGNAFGPMVAIRMNGAAMLVLALVMLSLRPAFRRWVVEH